jgi:hypothetical protein
MGGFCNKFLLLLTGASEQAATGPFWVDRAFEGWNETVSIYPSAEQQKPC